MSLKGRRNSRASGTGATKILECNQRRSDTSQLRGLGIISRERDRYARVIDRMASSDVGAQGLRVSVKRCSLSLVKNQHTVMKEARSGGQAHGILIGTP